jgi:predicted phage terminase large subunit-like protein
MLTSTTSSDETRNRISAKTSPAALARYASPYPYSVPRHLKLLNNLLVKAVKEPNKRYVVSMPPRHGKSELTSIYFPAWATMKYPNTQVMLIAYEANFAASWGGKARDVVGEFGPSLHGVHGDPENWARNMWRVAKRRPEEFKGHSHKGKQFAYSYMYTAGVQGPITGKGADVLLVDDPIKNHVDVITPEARDKMWDWWQSTAHSRLMKNGSAIVVATRWHMDDLSGRLLEQAKNGEEDWVGINLPAMAEENDPLGREVGEALWPEMFDEEALAAIKRAKHPYWWSAMYQGRPTPLEGGIIKREWMNNRYTALPQMQRVIQTVDAAYKTGVGNDPSCIATWGTDGFNFYLLDCWTQRVEFPELKRAISDQFYRWNPSGIYVEDASAGQAIIQEMGRETMLPIIPKPVWGNDIARGTAAGGMFHAGKVILPDHREWLSAWIEEHVAFPNAPHDDKVTCTYYALEELGLAGVPIMEFVG